MESKNMTWMLPFTLVLLFSTLATCDVDKDREKCANDLVALATCLPYVSGESKSPPVVDCCNGLKTVLHKSPQCICLLVKDRNDPSLGLKINATLALSLPSQCHAPADISACPGLLHLPPNSPDAKVFEDFANNGNKGNATTTNSAPVAANSSSGKSTATSADGKSDGGKTKRWLGIEIVVGLLVPMIFDF